MTTHVSRPRGQHGTSPGCSRRGASVAVLLLILCGAACKGSEFTKSTAMIPMRDGVLLRTDIFTPARLEEPLPILLTRTPYEWRTDAKGLPAGLSGELKEMADESYIFVFQNIRGRHGSEGRFVMVHPPRVKGGVDAVDEGSDAFDTISWLLTHLRSNGRVGMIGTSYDGWLAVMALLDPHPALKAVSPQGSIGDMFIGDDFYQGGAFRLDPSFEAAAFFEAGGFAFDKDDLYDWFLALGPLSGVNRKHFRDRSGIWSDVISHWKYDEFWASRSVIDKLGTATVPTLNVAGWWDAEDPYGPMAIYHALEAGDRSGRNFLVVGPWRHGGWADDGGRRLGKLDFSCYPSRFFRQSVQAPWFAWFLKDKGRLDLPEAMVFQTGTNRWEAHDSWPPRPGTISRSLYFRSSGRLTADPPTATDEHESTSYVSDPARPVPYSRRPIKAFWHHDQALWKVEDQRFVHLRPDVVSWETTALDEDLVVSGPISAHLLASTTGTDCDWIVKLIDVYPGRDPSDPEMGGYQLTIADGVLRSKFRRGFDRPEPLVPGQVEEFVTPLGERNHRFLKGHRIMVQVQSTWFPLIDLNPQRFVEIPAATEADYQATTQRVYHSPRFASKLVIPGLPDARPRLIHDLTIADGPEPIPLIDRVIRLARAYKKALAVSGVIAISLFGLLIACPLILGISLNKARHQRDVARQQAEEERNLRARLEEELRLARSPDR